MQETCNFDVLYAYLTSTNYDFSYDRAKNLRPKRNIKTAMNHEILLYGIAQKEQLGFDKAVEECKYRMSRYGVTPNMLVLPPQMLLYMALAPEEKLTYAANGPQTSPKPSPVQDHSTLNQACTLQVQGGRTRRGGAL